MEFIRHFDLVISAAFLICYSYQIIYLIVPFIKKIWTAFGGSGDSLRIFSKNGASEGGDQAEDRLKKNRYRVLICARNERTVIDELIRSIHMAMEE